MVQPGEITRWVAGFGGTPAVLQALRHLRQKHAAHTPEVHLRQQLIQCLQAVGFDVVAAQVGNFARRFVGCNPFRKAAQVFNQHHTQGGWQGPDFAQVEFAALLVGTQKMHQQIVIKRTISVRHERPRHAVDTRQSRQRLILQYRQCPKIAARQSVVNFLELRLDEVKVVQQPFGCRADVVPGSCLYADVVVRQAQGLDIASQPREEGGGEVGRINRPVGVAQAASMLRKAHLAKELRTNGRLNRAARAVQNIAKRLRRLRDQAKQRSIHHDLVQECDGGEQQCGQCQCCHEARRGETMHTLGHAVHGKPTCVRTLA